jgi:hypothetical protein
MAIPDVTVEIQWHKIHVLLPINNIYRDCQDLLSHYERHDSLFTPINARYTNITVWLAGLRQFNSVIS